MNRKKSITNFILEKKGGIVLLFILIVTFFLRLYNLGYHDFWYDEALTVSYAQYPWANWNAPLYWILLHYWIKIFGISEFSLRFPSLVFSFLSVIFVFLLGKELFNKKVGIVASIFIGLSPFHLWYAQEARDYSMVLFFGLLSSWLFYKALREDNNKLWLSFILVSIIGLYTNYFYIFLFLAHGLYLICFKKLRLSLKNTFWFLIIILGFLPYLNRFLSKLYYIWGKFWIPKPEWGSLVITLENFALGYNGFPLIYLIANILGGIFFISALRGMGKRDLRQPLIFSTFLFLIPIIFVFFFSKAFFSIYLDRALIVFSPYYYLTLSLGIVFLKRVMKVILFVILIFILFIADYRFFKDRMFMPFVHHVGTCMKRPIKPLVRFMEDNLGSQDIIAFTSEFIMPSFRLYGQRKLYPLYYFYDPEFLDTNWGRPRQENKYCKPFFKINQLKFKRLWVISSDWARSGKLGNNSQSVKDWLDKNLKLRFSREFDGSWLFAYERRR